MKIRILCLALLSNVVFASDIVDNLKNVPGLTVAEVISKIKGYRQINLTIEQPTDHANPSGETFQQKLVLLHRDEKRPMILETSGYKIFGVRLAQVTDALKANQIQVEHRYFPDAMPASRDWSKLTIEQSAHDFHRIVEKLRPLYSAKWLNTGASKGGMTSVYFRRFHPNDVDGTLALVAPLSFALEDRRFVDFVRNVDSVLGEGCGAKLFRAQKRMLTDWAQIQPLAEFPGEYTRVGGHGPAYEVSVMSLPFAFWQYGYPQGEGCSNVPGDSATPLELAKFLDKYNGNDSSNDESLGIFEPYFYQSATQLGGPANDTEMFHDFYRFLHLDPWKPLLPTGTQVNYDSKPMRDVEAWATTHADKILYIYGTNDPWSSGMFPLNPNAETYRYEVYGGNHSANLIKLDYPEKLEVLNTLRRWLDVHWSDVKPLSNRSETEYLEDLNTAALRRLRLP